MGRSLEALPQAPHVLFKQHAAELGQRVRWVVAEGELRHWRSSAPSSAHPRPEILGLYTIGDAGAEINVTELTEASRHVDIPSAAFVVSDGVRLEIVEQSDRLGHERATDDEP